MGKSVLTLETIEPDRDFITIDGKEYSLRNADELSLADLSMIRRLANELVEKGKGLNIDSSPADIARIESATNETLAIIVLSLPDEVRDKLRQSQKTSIVEAFTAVASKKRAAKATEEEKESQKTSDGSSPGSDASTEARSATG